MSDEVDDLLRRTMTALDHQVPDGYFDTLASRMLARLDNPAPGDPGVEDTLPAASSPGLPAVALPEPAAPPAAPAHANRASAPVPATPAADRATPLPGPRARSNRRPILAAVGLGLAAAAGAMILVSTRDKVTSAQYRAEGAVQVREGAGAGAPRPSSAGAVAANAGSAAQGDAVAQVAADTPQVAAPAVAAKGAGGAGSSEEPNKRDDRAGKDAPGGTMAKGKLGTSSGHDAGAPASGGASKKAFVQKAGKPAAGRQALSPDDITRGMTAVAAGVRACFAGTRGVATVQVTVGPSGHVQKVTVTGPFAGISAGACVERAVKAATFPSRNGPERFSYDYLLSD